ncbi:uncharacterized protein LOC119729319 isoform X1 [Patiria miniata]|uniref:Histamine N-methyltransferase n=1 Tax=Patiria miniata TaxID=46514 RepID=A0A914A200_PATMI|nr:uncharacterized protein LOC119729319 isoform X1 [Patiria miniata]
MSENAVPSQTLTEYCNSLDYYNVNFDVYNRVSQRINRFSDWIDKSLPKLADSMEISLPATGTLNVLSVGAGNGTIDSRILPHLRDKVHPNVRAIFLEPDLHTFQQCQDLVGKESPRLQGIEFDWRQQTFQEYRSTAKEEDKFHFICCFNSIYYTGDMGSSLRYLYDKLHSGGILLITLVDGKSGGGQFWQFLNTSLGQEKDFFTSFDLEEACRKQNIMISEVQPIGIYVNVSCCFDPPQELTEDGRYLLDTITRSVNFAQTAAAELRKDVLRFLRSDTCSSITADGQVILDGSNSAYIIRRP